MAEVYRKSGRTLRYENGVFVRVDEAGEATEDGPLFRCHPVVRAGDLPEIDRGGVEATVREIVSLVAAPVVIERLVVSEGIADHEFGAHRWRETTRRIHLSLAFRSVRAIVDLGDFDLADVREIVAALPLSGQERNVNGGVRVAPRVTAALLPSLIGAVPPNVRLWQSAGGLDGKGQAIEALPLESRPWPNWYRPSYRSRPVRAPFHLRATCDVSAIDGHLPRAIALLAPPSQMFLHVLCVDGGEVFPARLRISRIEALAAETRWYPYGAGSFGAEMML